MTKVSVSLLFTFFSLVLSARAAWAGETIDLVIIETLPVPIVTESRVEFEKELARIMPDHELNITIYTTRA